MLSSRITDATRDRGDSTTSASSSSQSDSRLNPHAPTFTPKTAYPRGRSSTEVSSMDDDFPPLPKPGHKAPSSKMDTNATDSARAHEAPIATSELKGKDSVSEQSRCLPQGRAEPDPALLSDNINHQAPTPFNIPVVPLSIPVAQRHRRNQSSRGSHGKRRPFIFTWKKQEIKDPLLRAKHEADKRAMDAKTNKNIYIDDPEHYYKDFKVQHGGYTHIPRNHPAQRDGWPVTSDPNLSFSNRPASENGLTNRADRGNSVSSASSGSSYFPAPTSEYGLCVQETYEHEWLGSPLNPQAVLESPLRSGATLHMSQEGNCGPMGFVSYPYSPLPPDIPRVFEQPEQQCGDFVPFDPQPSMMGFEGAKHTRHERARSAPMADSIQRKELMVDWIKVHRELHERAVSFEDDEVFCKGLRSNEMF